MKKLSLLALALIFVAAACSQHSQGRAPMSADEKNFRANCGSCHRLYEPESESPAKWPEILTTHSDRLDLSDSLYNSILRYLKKEMP